MRPIPSVAVTGSKKFQKSGKAVLFTTKASVNVFLKLIKLNKDTWYMAIKILISFLAIFVKNLRLHYLFHFYLVHYMPHLNHVHGNIIEVLLLLH